MDTTILQRLYQGELRPEEQYHPRLKENCEMRKALREREHALLEKLDDDIQKEVGKILDELNLIGVMELEDVYIQGMKLGAKLALELLGKEE